MGKNLNTNIWTVDGSGYTQTLQTLFTGDTPVYTHAQHIDNSFNLAVCGVSGQNSRMLFHLTDRTRDDGYSVDSTPNIFIGDYIYDNRGAYTDAIGVAYGNVGGVSNFVIEPNSGNQPTANFKIAVEYPYRDRIWYPAINIRTLDPSNGTIGSDNWLTLNDLDDESTAADAQPGETWWEYYKRNESNYILTIGQNNLSQYYKIGSFDSTSVFEGERSAGIPHVVVKWLKHPRSYLNYDYQGAYPYYDNNRGYYDDLQFDLLLPFSSDWAVKKAEWNDTRWTEYWTEEQHNIIYGLKIDKDIVLKLICSYGMPFSFGSSTTIQFADPDYALPEIVGNIITGKYFRGDECATADTDNNRWGNVKNIDNKPAGGGGGGGSDEDEDTAISTAGAPYAKGLVNYYAMTAGSPLIDHISEALSTWDLQNTGKDLYKNLVSCKLIKPPAAIPTTGSEPFTIYGEKPQYQGADITLPVVSGNPDATFGPYSISRKFNDFRDYAPYTRVSIYLPYCGWCDLPSHVVGRSVTVKYFTDIIAATVRAVVFCGNNIVAEAAGVMGLDIPFTADAVGMKQAGVVSGLTAYAGGALQTAAGVASIVTTKGGKGIGETLSGASKLVSAYTQTAIAFNENTTEISGKNGDGCCLSGATNIIIKIIRPKYGASSDPPYVPAGFAHSIGFVSNKQVRVGNVSGLLIADNVDTSGIAGATDAERAEIKRVLETGLIVNAAPE